MAVYANPPHACPTPYAPRSSHLTNDAVQKHLDTYNTFEDHCKMDMEGLQVCCSHRQGLEVGGGAAGVNPIGCQSSSQPQNLLNFRILTFVWASEQALQHLISSHAGSVKCPGCCACLCRVSWAHRWTSRDGFGQQCASVCAIFLAWPSPA